MHDRNGNPLKVGDKVTIEAVITNLCPTPDYCNVTVETVHPRKPDGHKECITLNTAVMERVGRVIDADAGDNVKAAAH